MNATYCTGKTFTKHYQISIIKIVTSNLEIIILVLHYCNSYADFNYCLQHKSIEMPSIDINSLYKSTFRRQHFIIFY